MKTSERRFSTTIINRGFGEYDALILRSHVFRIDKSVQRFELFSIYYYYYYYRRSRHRRNSRSSHENSRSGHEVRSWFNDSKRRLCLAAARVTTRRHGNLFYRK